MDHYAVEERRRSITSHINEALQDVRDRGATGIEIQATGGAKLAGDWATVTRSSVEVYSSRMDVAAIQKVHIDDVVTVEVVWSDVTPPFVAPSDFGEAFDQAVVQGVESVFGAGAIANAIGDREALARNHADRTGLDLSQIAVVDAEILKGAAAALRVTPDSPMAKMSVVDVVDRPSPAIAKILDSMTDEEGSAFLSEISANDRTFGDLVTSHPVLAVSLALERISNDIRRTSEPYMPRERLRAEVEWQLGRTFRAA